jgi:hypothetical protein
MNHRIAKIISFVGHPLWVLSYILLFLLLLNPFAFGIRDISDSRAMILLVSVFMTSFLIPGFGVALMKPLGLISSLEMRDKQERIGPYIVSGVFYLWLFKNLLSGGIVPVLYTKFVLGATIGLFLAFFINIFTKISAHAVGMGGFVAMLLVTQFSWRSAMLALPIGQSALVLSPVVVVMLGCLLAGLVGTARLALDAHTPADLYRGYAAGFAAVLLANIPGLL